MYDRNWAPGCLMNKKRQQKVLYNGINKISAETK